MAPELESPNQRGKLMSDMLGFVWMSEVVSTGIYWSFV